MTLIKKMMAFVFLGWHFCIHLMQKLTRFSRYSKKDFLSFYKPDRIYPINQAWQNDFTRFSQCIACGLCDVHCPQKTSLTHSFSPSYLVRSFSRLLTEHTLFVSSEACQDCAECEKQCPQNIPITSLIQFMGENK